MFTFYFDVSLSKWVFQYMSVVSVRREFSLSDVIELVLCISHLLMFRESRGRASAFGAFLNVCLGELWGEFTFHTHLLTRAGVYSGVSIHVVCR